MSIVKSDLVFFEKINQGGMGSVHRAQDKSDMKELAIKYCTVGADADGRDLLKLLQREGRRMMDLRHENVLKCFGAVVDCVDNPGFLGIAVEYMCCGSITNAKRRMLKNTEQPLPESLRHRWNWDISKALAYLHSIKMVHKDVKGSNCMVDESLHAKLGDFGLCRAEDVTTTLPFMATWTHLPPECLENMKDNVRAYSCEFDIYAFGITMFEILTDVVPFEKQGEAQIQNNVQSGKRPDDFASLPGLTENVVRVMHMCWAQDPKQRPTAESVAQTLGEIYQPLHDQAEQDGNQCKRFLMMEKGKGDGIDFDTFTRQVQGKSVVQHDGIQAKRVPMLNGQPPLLNGQPAMPNQERQFQHLTYEQAKVTLDLGTNGIHLRDEMAAVSQNHLRSIGNMISTDFFHIGRCLLFEDPQLKTIKYDNERDGITEANQQMLRQWSEKHAERASRKWLATACLSLGRRDLIEVLAS